MYEKLVSLPEREYSSKIKLFLENVEPFEKVGIHSKKSQGNQRHVSYSCVLNYYVCISFETCIS